MITNNHNYILINEKLTTILQEHENETDTLSKQLLKQGRKFQIRFKNSDSQSHETILTTYLNKLNVIFLNHFGNFPKYPWLLDDLPIEKEVLDHGYCQPWSLLSSDPMPIKPIPHIFSKKIADWINSLEAPLLISAQIQVQNIGQTALIVFKTENELDVNTAWDRYEKFQQIVEVALITRKKMELTKELKQENKELQIMLNQKTEERQLAIQNLDNDLKMKTEELKVSIEKIQTDFQSALDLHKKVKIELQENFKQTQNELSQANTEIKSQNVSIGNLKNQVSSLSRQLG